MSTYSYAQIEQIWINGGGSATTAPIAAAIAMAESSGEAAVTSGNPDGGTNVGLWQLDTPGGKGAGYSVSQLQDPTTNAKVAVAGSSNGKDWSAWETYVRGTYKQFMSGAAPSSAGVPAGGGGASTTAASGGGVASDVANFLTGGLWDKLGDLLKIFHTLVSPSFWARVGAFLLGIGLFAFAIYALLKANTDQGLMPQMPSVVPIPV